jgi:hypothetical protein
LAGEAGAGGLALALLDVGVAGTVGVLLAGAAVAKDAVAELREVAEVDAGVLDFRTIAPFSKAFWFFFA